MKNTNTPKKIQAFRDCNHQSFQKLVWKGLAFLAHYHGSNKAAAEPPNPCALCLQTLNDAFQASLSFDNLTRSYNLNGGALSRPSSFGWSGTNWSCAGLCRRRQGWIKSHKPNGLWTKPIYTLWPNYQPNQPAETFQYWSCSRRILSRIENHRPVPPPNRWLITLYKNLPLHLFKCMSFCRHVLCKCFKGSHPCSNAMAECQVMHFPARTRRNEIWEIWTGANGHPSIPFRLLTHRI